MSEPSDDLTLIQAVTGAGAEVSIKTLDDLAAECHRDAVVKGFWDDRDVDDVLSTLAELAMIHSEVSEATEAVRKGDAANFAEELADIVIRVMDTAEAHGVELEREVVTKMKANRARPHKHGKLA